MLSLFALAQPETCDVPPEDPHVYCTAENLRMRMDTKPNVRGFESMRAVQLAWRTLEVCGVVVLEGAIAPKTAETVHHAVAAHFEGVKERIRAFKPEILDPSTGYSAKTSIQTVWPDAAERSKMRFEVKLPLEPPYLDEAITSPGPVVSLLTTVLRSKMLEIDTFSYVVSMAGAPTQRWHDDAGSLFKDWGGEQIPPHGLVAAVALDTLSEESGPTEFVLGSHRSAFKGELKGLPRASFAVDKGGVVLFDLRTKHRGGANESPNDRAILYISYVLDWWQDAINFKTPQTVGWDRHNTTRARKLFRRLDAAAWTSQLEAMLAERGVDLDGLRSTFHPYTYMDLYV